MARTAPKLTEVQARCLGPGVAGRDLLCRSGTGSGKTLAFLMVAFERIVRHGGPDPTRSFPILVLSPVTDLATQIAVVARTMCKHHAPMRTELVIGGTNERNDIKRLSDVTARIDVLVATPGRLDSLLQQSSTIRDRLSRCQTFVVDEADKLTDAGFLHVTRKIHRVAKEGNDRLQTLMFSATMDRERILQTGLLTEDAEFIDVPRAPEGGVTQNAVVCRVSETLGAVVSIVQEAKARSRKTKQQKGGNAAASLSDATLNAVKESIGNSPTLSGYRIMVFMSSNAFIDFFSKAFAHALPDVRQFVLHGGMPQHKRSKTSDAFRTTDDCVLFTSDASARGVDYPDVSCVVQIGFDSRAEYTQRVGRTARAGKSGESFLVVCPQEIPAIASQGICDALEQVYVSDAAHVADTPCARVASQSDEYTHTDDGFPDDMRRIAKNAYRGWLGALASRWKRLKMAKSDTLDMAVEMAAALHLPPPDEADLRRKLHI
jgi:ATP-dependent RNA helicase MSS116, mitochondrial